MTLRRAGSSGLLLLASLLACSRILVLGGWPDNHDGVACFQKVEIFRRAFADGNLMPLWTPLAENGYGSPFPFFYHRLFNTLAGAVALATGSAYTAVKIVIPLLLFLGALGMRRALLTMGLGPFHAVSGALLLVFSNYAYTDWYVRGAFGEFAAFMLVPWLTFAALGVVRGTPRAGWGLGAVLSLIFFAQSTIFVFAFALVLVAFAGALVLSQDWRRALLNLGQAALVREMLPAWFLVVGSAVFYLVLQTPLSAPLYRLAPPIQFIQFPWRLLAFSTSVSIFAPCLSLDLLEAGPPRPAARSGLRAVLLFAVLFQVWYGVGRPPTDRIFSVKEIEASLTTERLAATSVFSGAFRPRGVSLPPRRPFLEATGCVVQNASPEAALYGIVDVPELRLVVDAAPGGSLVINQFANPFLAVSAGGRARVETTAWGTILVRPEPGRSEIVLRHRGLLAALKERLFGG